MIGLLTKKGSGRPTEAAKSLAQSYREILIDEYQDSNAVQERIFQAVSRNGKNLFMVGDVKQSIYRFRLADPSIFLSKYDAYPPLGEQTPGEPQQAAAVGRISAPAPKFWKRPTTCFPL